MKTGRTIENVREILSEKDHRLTPQREAVLRVLIQKSGSHPSADEIFFSTKSDHPEIGLATVYRTLELLCEVGVAYRLEFGGAGARYEFNQDLERHYHHHLICINCGKIMEFREDLLEGIEEAVARETGFLVTDHSLRLYGYCKECRGKEQNQGEDSDAAKPTPSNG